MRKFLDFLIGAVRDPRTLDGSSARIIAFICTALAAADVIVCLVRNIAPHATTIAALIGGGAVSILGRKTADGDP